MKIEKWAKKNIKDLSGKNILITGATGGIGQILCKSLAFLNANLFVACRSKEKSKSFLEELKSYAPNANIQFVELDLASKSSVDLFIEYTKNINVDYFFCNAGVYNVPVIKTESGFNNIFQINFLSYYYMIKKLLPHFQKIQTRVIVTSSIAHNYSQINANDIDFSSERKPSKIYGNSKRFLTYSLFELFKNQTKTTLAIVHPGITLTNMTNHYPKAINWLVKIGIKLLFPSPQKATRNILFGITTQTPYHTWIGPKFFNIWGNPKLKKLNTATKTESQQIFAIAEQIVEI